MGNTRLERLAPLAGVLFTVIFAVGFLVTGDTPDTDAPGDEIIDHYDDSGKVFVAIIALLLAAVLFMFFVGVLRARLRERGMEWLASVAFGGAVVYATGLAIFAMAQIALLDASDLGDPQVAQALNIIDNDNFFPVVVGQTVLLLAVAWHVLQIRSLPMWLGWASLVLALLAFGGPAGFIAFLLFPIWTLVTGVVLYRRTAAPVAVAASPAT